MEKIKELILDQIYYVIKSTSYKLVGFQIIDKNIKVGQIIKIQKENRIKNIVIETITKIDDGRYNIQNSNICITIKRK